MNHDKDAECIFCLALQQDDGAGNLVVARCKETFLILNRYPYTSGHLMIVPYAHCAALEDLPSSARGEMIDLAAQAMQVLRILYAPDGFNLGMNVGEAAGAGLPVTFIYTWFRAGLATPILCLQWRRRFLPESLENSYRRIGRAGKNNLAGD